MTVFVIRDGRLVPKASMAEAIADARSIFPSPRVSRLDAYESPVTGKTITSHRQREADMNAAGAYDPRDLPTDHQFKRGRAAQAKETSDAT